MLDEAINTGMLKQSDKGVCNRGMSINYVLTEQYFPDRLTVAALVDTGKFQGQRLLPDGISGHVPMNRSNSKSCYEAQDWSYKSKLV